MVGVFEVFSVVFGGVEVFREGDGERELIFVLGLGCLKEWVFCYLYFSVVASGKVLVRFVNLFLNYWSIGSENSIML